MANMNAAGPVLAYQTCMLEGASLTDMIAGLTVKDMANVRMQLLQIWLTVGANVTYMDADKMKL